MIECFSNYSCKTRLTKVITSNQSQRTRYHNEPIRARVKSLLLLPSAGKLANPIHDWFWTYI